MSRLLLDTTFLIDGERGVAGLDALFADDDDVAIAAISLAELAAGVQLGSARQRPRRQAFLDRMSAEIPILP